MTAREFLNRPFILNNKINDKNLDITENCHAVFLLLDLRSIIQVIET